MTRERYRSFSARISQVLRTSEMLELSNELTREPKDDDRDTLLQSLGQHAAMLGLDPTAKTAPSTR